MLDVVKAGDLEFHSFPLREIGRLVLLVLRVEQVSRSFYINFEAAHRHTKSDLIAELFPLLERVEDHVDGSGYNTSILAVDSAFNT